jgi:hypothetical protein
MNSQRAPIRSLALEASGPRKQVCAAIAEFVRLTRARVFLSDRNSKQRQKLRRIEFRGSVKCRQILSNHCSAAERRAMTVDESWDVIQGGEGDILNVPFFAPSPQGY